MAGFWKRAWASAAIAVTSWAVGATAAQAQATDACPNGWSPETAVEFAPPVPAVESGVANRSAPAGARCSTTSGRRSRSRATGRSYGTWSG